MQAMSNGSVAGFIWSTKLDPRKRVHQHVPAIPWHRTESQLAGLAGGCERDVILSGG